MRNRPNGRAAPTCKRIHRPRWGSRYSRVIRSKTKSSGESIGRRRRKGRTSCTWKKKKACAAQTGTRDVGDTLVMCTTVRHDQIALVFYISSTQSSSTVAQTFYAHLKQTPGVGTRTWIRKYKTILPCTLRCHWEMWRGHCFCFKSVRKTHTIAASTNRHASSQILSLVFGSDITRTTFCNERR